MNTIDGDLGIESVCDGPVALSFCPFFFGWFSVWGLTTRGLEERPKGSDSDGHG